jgi:hypothetical protein
MTEKSVKDELLQYTVLKENEASVTKWSTFIESIPMFWYWFISSLAEASQNVLRLRNMPYHFWE